jgi:hypothetical protein
MGLWLKCPGCQGLNPLSLKVCPNCGQDLDKLSADQRVYVIGPAVASPPAPSPATTEAVVQATPEPEEVAATQPSTPSPEAGSAHKPAKKPKKARKKKS